MDMEALKKRQEWSRDEPLSEMSDSTETLINHLVAIDTNYFDNNSNNTVLVADIKRRLDKKKKKKHGPKLKNAKNKVKQTHS